MPIRNGIASNFPGSFSSSLLCGIEKITFGKKLINLEKWFLWTWFQFFEKLLLRKFPTCLNLKSSQATKMVILLQVSKEKQRKKRKRMRYCSQNFCSILLQSCKALTIVWERWKAENRKLLVKKKNLHARNCLS